MAQNWNDFILETLLLPHFVLVWGSPLFTTLASRVDDSCAQECLCILCLCYTVFTEEWEKLAIFVAHIKLWTL